MTGSELIEGSLAGLNMYKEYLTPRLLARFINEALQEFVADTWAYLERFDFQTTENVQEYRLTGLIEPISIVIGIEWDDAGAIVGLGGTDPKVGFELIDAADSRRLKYIFSERYQRFSRVVPRR